jgi:carboxypeptidase T
MFRPYAPFRLRELLALLFLIGSLHAFTQGSHSRVRVLFDGRPEGLQQLAALGLAVDHGEVRQGYWIETDLSAEELAIARNNGFTCEILIADVVDHYVRQNREPMPPATRANRETCLEQPAYPLPEHFALGSMGGYFTWEEMLDILDAMRAEYPQLISAKEVIGTSHEGRPIHFVRISNAPDVDQDKPEVLYDALHHSREPASLSQLITFMWYLLEGYGSDPEVTYIVDHMELYFVPCINPDGYVFNAMNFPEGGGMWRKNRRNNGNGTMGVDLNRNYAQGWGIDNTGSSPNGSSEVYRGPSPFSEPETQAMRDFCNAHTFRLALNYHTFGNLLIYPWGYLPSFYTPDSAVFVQQGVELTLENRYRFGTADQTVNYVVNGGSDDWMYGEQSSKPKIFSMTPEAGVGSEGFWPPAWRIPAICQENIGQNLRTAHLAGVFGRATDTSPAVFADLEDQVHFSLLRLGQEAGSLTVSLEPLDQVAAVGEPVTFTTMMLMEELAGSIAITLDPAITEGSTFRYVLAVNNGVYTYRDTITKVHGTPLLIFSDDGTNLNQWQNQGWGITTTGWTSPPSSVSDSPWGLYVSNSLSRLTLLAPLDLEEATSATLNFNARWDIEAWRDHVQVLASSDGISWTPLCGRYTRAGSEMQDEGEPVYDGQRPDWVREEIDLGGYLGGPLRLRFQLTTDANGNYPGFQWDDLAVTITSSLPSSVSSVTRPPVNGPFPNPANEQARFTYSGTSVAGAARLDLFDALGALVLSEQLSAARGTHTIDVAHLRPGVYTYSFNTGEPLPAQGKLVIVR